jgi:mRNA-degrading endonuclease RelE of RelBE toxin-antitoxin system
MAFTVKLKRSAEKELENLPARIQDKVINILLSLKEDPLPHNSKKASWDGHKGDNI